MENTPAAPADGDFFTRLEQHRSRLTRKQIELAAYIERNFRESAFLSSVELGRRIGVSEATVIRLAQALGYRGFLEMIKEIRLSFHEELSTVRRMERDIQEFCDFRKSLLNDRDAVGLLAEEIERETMDSLMGLMEEAKTLHIIGRESSLANSIYAEYLFQHLREGVSAVRPDNQNLQSHLDSAGPHCLLIAFAFPRYPEQTLAAVSMYRDRRTPVIGITDSRLSPLHELAQLPVLVPSAASRIDYTLPAMALLRAMFAEYASRNRDSVTKVLDRRERFHREQNTFLS